MTFAYDEIRNGTAPHPGFDMQATYDPSATHPVLFIDFDGVVNAVTQKNKKVDRNVWADYTYVDMPTTIGENPSYPVNYSLTVVQFLHEMVEAGVEIVWLTTWSEDTAFFQEILGTPEAKWLGESGKVAIEKNLHQTKEWWKLEAVREYAGTRPVIWMDDHHYYNTRKVNEWVNARSRYAATLIITPQERIGLTKKMLRETREFVTALTGAKGN